jgi:hypothetical protein
MMQEYKGHLFYRSFFVFCKKDSDKKYMIINQLNQISAGQFQESLDELK